MKGWTLATEPPPLTRRRRKQSVRVRHDVDNSCPPAAPASPAALHSMYDAVA